MASAAGSARLAAGSNRTANNWNPNSARARRRRNLNDMFYPGALTSRLKRYAAEPAPDEAKLTLIRERTANVAGKPPRIDSDKPASAGPSASRRRWPGPVNQPLGLTVYGRGSRPQPPADPVSQSAMRQHYSLARFLASAAVAALLAAGLGGCQTMSDITGSLTSKPDSAANANPQRAAEIAGERYRANPRDAD